MPAIKVTNQATSTNALASLPFTQITVPTLLTMYASCVTNTDVVSLSCGSKEIVRNANPNIESSADVVDIDRDLIIAREPLPPGQLSLAVTATTAVNFLIVLEQVGT